MNEKMTELTEIMTNLITVLMTGISETMAKRTDLMTKIAEKLI